MADDGLFMENLDEFINDEDRTVTYKWLSRTLSVPANQAKQMLFAYLTKQRQDKNANHISATYLVGGRCKMDEQMVHQYILTNDDNLDDTKSYFDMITSVHVYSLQKNKPKDSNAFYTVDYNIHQEYQNESNRWSNIYCKESKPLSDGGASRGHSKEQTGKENTVPAMSASVVNGQGSSNSTGSDKPKSTAQKPKKGQLPNMGMFVAKTEKKSTVEEEKAQPPEPSTDKPTDKTHKPTKTAGKSKPAGGMLSFFGKPVAAQKEEKKADKCKEKSPEKPKEKSPDKPKAKIPEKTTEPKKTEHKPAPKNTRTQKQGRRRIKNLDSSDEEEDPIPKKFTKLVSDSESEDEEQPIKSDAKVKKADKNQEVKNKKSNKKEKITKDNTQEENKNKSLKTNRKRKKESKEASSEEESPVRSSTSCTVVGETPVACQSKEKQTKTRKRRKVMRSKTYVDDDGFMVTEKVYESESTDASDIEEETALKQERAPSPQKTSPDTKPKKITTELKPPKQAGIMNFFKKK